jgi:hypothetical protein
MTANDAGLWTDETTNQAASPRQWAGPARIAASLAPAGLASTDFARSEFDWIVRGA